MKVYSQLRTLYELSLLSSHPYLSLARVTGRGKRGTFARIARLEKKSANTILAVRVKWDRCEQEARRLNLGTYSKVICLLYLRRNRSMGSRTHEAITPLHGEEVVPKRSFLASEWG